MFGRTNNAYAYQSLPQPQYMNPYWNGMPAQWQNYHIPQNFQGATHTIPYQPQWNQPLVAPLPKNDYTKMLFQNPLQPQDDPIYGFYGQQPEYQNFNPYPQQNFLPKQPSGLQSIMNSFKSQEGNLDLNKMVDTAGQMVNAVTQVSSLVKGLGGMFKV